jgi:hypothetical protein
LDRSFTPCRRQPLPNVARAAGNRANRIMIEHYLQVIEQQQDEIEELRRQLEECDRPRPHCDPAIH